MNEHRIADTANSRYERKFVVSELTQHEIESLVKLHPAMFVEIYHPRYVNNLYLDTFDMKGYLDNVEGMQARIKVRIRWYGDLFGLIEQPALEIKIKNGSIGRKERFRLVPFAVDERLQTKTVLDVFRRSEIPDALKCDLMLFEFSLLNRYRRKYFQSVDRDYRVTIDSELTFYEIRDHSNTFLHRSIDWLNTVVELKYGPEKDQNARKISSQLPFRMTKSSKYVTGVDRLCLW